MSMRHLSHAVRTLALWAAAVPLLFVGCTNDDETGTDPVPEAPTLQKIALDKENLTLNVGDKYTFEVTLTPEEVQNVTLTWASSNPEVVSVENGIATALASGEATVTVQANEKISASCQITVLKAEVKSVTLDKERIELFIGETAPLAATVQPADAEYVLNWKTADEKIATVDDKGTVTGVAVGETSVTVQAGKATAQCQVVVKAVPVESITLDPKNLELEVGETLTISATVLPENATDKTVVWSSLNREIATVDDKGAVTGVAIGETTVTVQAGDITAQCPVVVTGVPAETVMLDKNTLELKEGETFTLTATVLPENATDKTVVWSSLNETVATVDASGTVTAVSAGNAVIKAAAGEVEGVCLVTVTAPVVPSASANIGDYFYSDGTWSTELSPEKTVIGVVFYVGDITASDTLLASEHSGCTHGLVVSIAQASDIPWQSNAAGYNSTVSAWIEQNAASKYATILAGNNAANGEKPVGYNNTRAIEAFNADPANSTWPVEAVQQIATFRTEHPAPASTSDWYLPSAKELSLLTAGDVPGSITEIMGKTNLDLINGVLGTVSGATQIAGPGPAFLPIPAYYHSSSEADATQVFQMITLTGMTVPYEKAESATRNVRPILAF